MIITSENVFFFLIDFENNNILYNTIQPFKCRVSLKKSYRKIPSETKAINNLAFFDVKCELLDRAAWHRND